MKINTTLLNQLSSQAAESPRLRMNFDLRDSENDTSQRMLNALEMGTVLPIHRHQNTSETIIVIRGALKEYYHDDQGNITETFELSANGPTFGLNIPKGQWHSLEVTEPQTVIIEMKNGEYHALNSNDVLSVECRV